MKFHGLFIGIDRHKSSQINWLSCAKRDAVALHALFADTFGDNAILLTDGEATGSAIESAFQRLRNVEKDDFVVIAFSGHGSESHQLVTYDTDPAKLEETSIPLSTLTEWFSQIPAKNVVCFLDCCFSGGMGAKALKVDAVPRDLKSEEVLLSQLAGSGRIIFTATLPNEQAWETQQSGHGLLTFYLIEAFTGANEIRSNGLVGTYKLLDHVSQRVIEAAKRIGKEQHPSMRGTIDEDLQWPLFRTEPRYSDAFPSRVRAIATTEVHSLEGFGFPAALVDVWSASIPALNQLQVDAINEFGILRGDSLVVSAPTSSGKTMIGELAGLKGALERKRSFFLFPLKALVNDKLKHFERLYSDYGIRTIRATGDSTTDDILPLMRGQYDICLMTYEKFTALAVANPQILEQAGTVIIDEAQMIIDKSRGVNLEFLLTLIKARSRRQIEPQLIALSAVIGQTNGFENWLGGRLLRRVERPVPIDEGVIRGDGSWRYLQSDTGEEKIEHFIDVSYGKGSSQDLIKPLVRRLVNEDKQVIVFREQRGLARGCATYLANFLDLGPVSSAIDALPAGDPSQASQQLRDVLSRGVAFHVSDLDPDERAVVEESFRSRPTALRVIAATTTLAMGINTPAEAVVIAGLKHPQGSQAPVDYSVAEYKNMVGRAGRLGFSDRGASFLVAPTSADENYYWRRYVLGSPEDLNSQFLVGGHDPRSIILRVLVAVKSASGLSQGLTADELVNFLESSFGAEQERAKNSAWKWNESALNAALSQLSQHKLLSKDSIGRYSPTELGQFAGESGIEVESVVRIVGALEGNSAQSVTEPTLIAATQLSVELDDVLFPINRKSTIQEPQTWAGEIRRQGVAGSVLSAFSRNAVDRVQTTLRMKKTAALLLWITEWPMSRIETTLTQFDRANDAAGAVRSLKSRTCDILPTTVRIAELLYPELNFGNRIKRLLARLELGIPADVVELAHFIGSRLSRGEYLGLRVANLATIGQIEAATDETLLAHFEGNLSKVALLRNAVIGTRGEPSAIPTTPILPEFVH